MSCGCGCCVGVERATPAAIANRPGLDALQRRVGTHALFLESMLARLSTMDVPREPADPDGEPPFFPLRALTARTPDDPAIALLDAWALVGDVLAFYQERIANEGYLRTATERRSVLELARLIGYRLRPGVAASVYLAFTVDKDATLIVPRGTRAQSVPAPGETMESFETGDPLDARAVWNLLCPRRTAPDFLQYQMPVADLYLGGGSTSLVENALLLLDFSAGQRLFAVREVAVEPDATCTTIGTPPMRTHVTLGPFPTRTIDRVRRLRAAPIAAMRREARTALGEARVALVEVRARGAVANRIRNLLDAAERSLDDAADEREAAVVVERLISALEEEHRASTPTARLDLDTVFGVVVDPLDAAALAARGMVAPVPGNGDRTGLGALLSNDALLKTPAPTPLSPARLARNPRTLFGPQAAGAPALLSTLNERLGERLYHAWWHATAPTGPAPQEVHAFRVKAAPFGHNAAFPTHYEANTGKTLPNEEDWALDEPDVDATREQIEIFTLALDAVYDRIAPGSWVVIVPHAGAKPLIRKVLAVDTVTRAAYGMSVRVTQLTLDDWWLSLGTKDREAGRERHRITALRRVTVYAQSEPLPLAERPVGDEVQGAVIELSGLFDGLQAGRWIIVAGERADLPGVDGRELAMIAGVSHLPRTVRPWGAKEEITLPGERVHTRLALTEPLAYVYRLDTVKVWGNVAKATHGETRAEVLGSGDATVRHQTFALKNRPLTYVSAPTPKGTETTLEVRVNDIRWHEADSLALLGSADRGYLTDAADGGTTSAIVGDGEHGARLPTGAQNVRAVYRSGIGKPGNVRAEQITLLATRPLGLKDVINPLRATGGADPDTRDQARGNAPLVTRALGRLVSVEDYADFARTFAGIGKASAAALTDGRRRVVHLTVAGAEDVALDDTSDVMANLRRALRDFGDPYQPFIVATRELLALVIAARVRIDPDYLWEKVERALRATMLETFGFARRELGQDVTGSEVISAMARVTGVTAVDLDVLAGFSEEDVRANLDTLDRKLLPAARVRARLARVRRDSETRATSIDPAQLAMLTPAIPDTLILTEWPL